MCSYAIINCPFSAVERSLSFGFYALPYIRGGWPTQTQSKPGELFVRSIDEQFSSATSTVCVPAFLNCFVRPPLNTSPYTCGRYPKCWFLVFMPYIFLPFSPVDDVVSLSFFFHVPCFTYIQQLLV